MNLVVDESIDRPIVDLLRQDGHTVLYVAELSPSIDDDAFLRRANERGALLITSDKDFGELVFRLRRIHTGVVLLRLAGLPPRGVQPSTEGICGSLSARVPWRPAGDCAGSRALHIPQCIRIDGCRELPGGVNLPCRF